MILEAFVDAAETSKTVTPKVGTAGRAAVDAAFKVSNGTVPDRPVARRRRPRHRIARRRT